MPDQSVTTWLENPILVKHYRSRLRPHAFWSHVAVVLILCLGIAWASFNISAYPRGTAIGLYLCLQAVILVVMGSAQVWIAISGAMASGILDFHRVSPVSARQLVLGFLFGAPIREYALFAITLPFLIPFVSLGEPSVSGLAQIMIAFLLLAWLAHGLALIIGLSLRSYRRSMGAMVVAALALFFMMSPILLPTNRALALVELEIRARFFGYLLPWLEVVLILIAPILTLIFLAAIRKTRSDLNHPLSKLQALVAVAAVGLMIEGLVWRGDTSVSTKLGPIDVEVLLNTNPRYYEQMPRPLSVEPRQLLLMNIMLIYVGVAGGLLVIPLVTPDRTEYLKGLRRESRQGGKRLSLRDDLTLNRAFMVAECLIILAILTLAGSHLDGVRIAGYRHPGSYSLAVATAVMVVGYAGLGWQFFLLRFGRRGMIYFSFFLFIAWLVPIFAGVILAMGTTGVGDEYRVVRVFSLSPIFGVGFIATPWPELAIPFSNTSVTIAQACAFTPAALFLFVFGSLLTTAQRGANREFRISQRATANDSRAPVAASLPDPLQERNL